MRDIVERLNESLTGRYRITRELGQGGMATVFLAEDLRHKRTVAVKVMRPELAMTLGPERFLREIEVSAGLNRPLPWQSRSAHLAHRQRGAAQGLRRNTHTR